MLAWLRRAPWVLSLIPACGGPTPAAATAANPTSDSRASRASLASRSEMPRELGGMRLGMTADDFVGVCGAHGAKAIPDERAQTVLCTVPPEPLLPQAAPVSFDGVVLGAFCGPNPTVCGLVYVVYGKASERDDQIRALLGDLTRRYGPPTAAEGYAASDHGRECVEGKSAVHFLRSWSFGPEQHPVGRIRLAFDCDLRDGRQDKEIPLTLLYDDANGIAIARTMSR
jgi:hypothetical protein